MSSMLLGLFMLLFLDGVFCIPVVAKPIPDQTFPYGTFYSYRIPNTTFSSTKPIHFSVPTKPGWVSFYFCSYVLEGSFDTYIAQDVFVSESYAYVADDTAGLKIIDISDSSSPKLTGSLDTNFAIVVFVSESYAYVADEQAGLKVIDISNPSNPTLTGSLDTHYAQGLFVSESYAYVGDGDAGFKVIDISNPSNPTLTGSLATFKSVDVFVSGSYAYVADYSEGLKIIDISNPSNPTLTGSLNTYRAWGVFVSGSYAYVADYSEGLKIIDISTPSNPTLTGSLATDYAFDIFVSESYAYVADREEGLKVIDVSDPSNPTLTGSLDTSLAFGVDVSDSYVYVADDGEGLKIIRPGTIEISGTCSIVGLHVVEVEVSDEDGSVVESFLIDCVCPENYTSDCNLTTCFGIFSNDSDEVCSMHGICVAFDRCECRKNYYGDDCSITTCENIFTNDTGASIICSGHGNCTNYDDCDCDSTRYFGSRCEITTCNKISSKDAFFVCSGHGECIDYDQCVCDDYSFYAGKFCQLWTCFGIGADNQTASCSGHGLCIDSDKCYCNQGWSSSETFGTCDVYYCNDIAFNDLQNEKLCSGRGICTNANLCTCRDGYEGSNCETWSCGSIDYLNFDSTCDGHGKCISPNQCECSWGYIGTNCKTNILYATVMAPILSLSGIFIVCLLCMCCVFVLFCVCVLFGFLFVLSVVVLRQFWGLKKFKKLEDFELLLKEQEHEKDTSVAHLKFKKQLFEVDYKEITTIRVLGQGGSGSIVFLARWKGNEVAFKCFKTKDLYSSQDRFDEFEKEVELMSCLSHPHIIRFFGACLNVPRVGVIMEYCPNGELLEFVLQFREENLQIGYPFDEKIRLLREVCSALEFLHSRNIIHRDLKCENVLVSSSQKAKLMDFGLSRLVDRMSVAKTKRIGTSVYIAPEMIRSDREYDSKCDVFSYAIMMYVLLTEDSNPYGGRNDFKIEFRVANNAEFRPDINLLKKKIPLESHWICEIIEKCWREDPNDRYSCGQICQLLVSPRFGETEKNGIEKQNESIDSKNGKHLSKNRHDRVFTQEDMANWLKEKLSLEERIRTLLERNTALEEENETVKEENRSLKKNRKIKKKNKGEKNIGRQGNFLTEPFL